MRACRGDQRLTCNMRPAACASRLAPPILVLAVFLGACAGVGVRPDGGSVIGRSAAAVIAPSGGLVDLPGVATVIFPPGAFEAPQEVEVRTTAEKETAEDFEATAVMYSPGHRLNYEVRVNTGHQAPLTDAEGIFVVPEAFLGTLPQPASVRAFVQILGGGAEELLDTFEGFPFTFDPASRRVRAVLPKAAFTNLRRSNGTFEAIIVLASTRVGKASK